MNDKTSYWLDMAEYDLETAKAMLSAGRYLYVGFMCHQVIEKTLKAAITATGGVPPYIHNLSRLAETAGLYPNMSNSQKDALDVLEPLNIQSRYPEDRAKLAATMSAGRCADIIRQTEELGQWIKATL